MNKLSFDFKNYALNLIALKDKYSHMRNIFTWIIFVFFTLNLTAQVGLIDKKAASNVVFIGHQTFKLVEGCQEIQLPSNQGILMVTVNDAEVTTLKRYKNYRLYELECTSNSAQAMNCSCGFSCWEDYELQQSICICATCSGKSGFASDYYLKIEGIERE